MDSTIMKNDINKLLIEKPKSTVDEEKIVIEPNIPLIDKGNDILETHDFYKDLSELMENEKFSNFFDKYFKTMTETKITVVYMKLYKEFKDKYKEINNEDLDRRINIFLIWKMMKDRNINKFVLHTVIDHLENPKKKNIFDEFKVFLKDVKLLED
jgi:hypothetical protein